MVQSPPNQATIVVEELQYPTSTIASPVMSETVQIIEDESYDVVISGTASVNTERVAISFNGGQAWLNANLVDGDWSFAFRIPSDEQLYVIQSRATSTAGLVQITPDTTTLIVDELLVAVADITVPTVNDTLDLLEGTTFNYVVSGVASADASLVEISTDGGTTWAPVSITDGSWTHSFVVPSTSQSYTIVSRATSVDDLVQTELTTVQLDVIETAIILEPTSTITVPILPIEIGIDIPTKTETIRGTAEHAMTVLQRATIITSSHKQFL